jgi:ABC-type bacteriocin/lantibiotic exporter with double-glycine peptidase domain
MNDKLTPGEFTSYLLFSSFQSLQLIFGFTQLVQLGSQLSEISAVSKRIFEILIFFNSNHKNNLENDIYDYLEFENVSIYSPDLKFLIYNLSFKINFGQNLLVMGPSGIFSFISISRIWYFSFNFNFR